MPKQSQEVDDQVQALLTENVIVNCGNTSKPVMKEWLKRLPSAQIKSLKLVNFNHYKSTAFFSSGDNYIRRAAFAFQQNPYIETLELGNEFVKSFGLYAHIAGSGTLRAKFIGMTNLKELILDNDGWEDSFFRTLQEYITDNRCTIETLELKSGLNAAEIEKLKIVFLNAHSLKNYKGAGQDVLQDILVEKWNSYKPQKMLTM